ncbi:uncharacterized protein LOC123885481 [Trifolium pratense]|uniref:uncharacterized protein LOC123885481 n=1 Tax=Trifolium pratense TaxID=57577 RepID=UPI001E6936EE|nr:uncharacterized protein LOC123885481 [Trifolium pratense]
MFGRIRASPSSLDSLEFSPPSKILKDDSFSIYEATLMKLKLGAKRDKSLMQLEEEEITNDCSVTDEVNMDVDCAPATVTVIDSFSVGDVGIMTLMDTDCSSSVTNASPIVVASESDSISTENNVEKPRQNNVSILDFFKPKDPVNCVNLSTKNDSCGSVSSSGSVVSNGTGSELCE